jgi:hypothetical protein
MEKTHTPINIQFPETYRQRNINIGRITPPAYINNSVILSLYLFIEK